MGKFEKKKKAKKSRKGLAAVVVLLVIAIALGLFVMPQVLYKLSGEENSSEDGYVDTVPDGQDAENEADATVHNMEAVEFPLLLEDGKLEIENAFQFDGINPDCGNQSGNDIAAITVKNLSGEYLSKAEISLETSEAASLHFVITDLPAGASTMAFDADNTSSSAESSYGNVACDAAFDAAASMNAGAVAVSVNGTHITLQNLTDSEINEVVVYCRSTLGDQYFGGITYTYQVNNLTAGGTAELDAVDCILGLAEVVQIAVNNQ